MNYTSLYQQLINYRLNTPPDITDYYEIHHILPKCLGGDNSDGNLVKLTAREHFIAHWLLVKMNVNQPIHILSKLASAFNKMCCSNRYNNGRIYTSKQYEIARKLYSKYHPMKDPDIVLKNINTRAIKQHEKKANYLKSLPLCLCGCGNQVKKHDRKYLFGHWDRSVSAQQGFTSEVKQHLSNVASQRINNLSESEKHNRLFKSLHSPTIDHKKRGEKISQSKRGKSTNQQYIMGIRYRKMSDEEFDLYLTGKSPRVHTRMKKLRKKYIENDN